MLGGTFDPPHYGHLILAELARDQLHLERVLWVVAADPPHKQGAVHTSVAHRIEMVRLSVDHNAGFAISRVDVERPGPHYSTDMLVMLQQDNEEAQFHFIIGSDSLRDLPTWHDPAELARLARLVVMRRPGVSFVMDDLEREIPGIGSSIVWLEGPHVDISAHDIRRRVREGRSIRYLVADAVQDYVMQQGLYRADE